MVTAPAEKPPATITFGSMPYTAALSLTHSTAAVASSYASIMASYISA